MVQFREADRLDLPRLHQIAWEAKAFWGYPLDWMEAWKPDLTIQEHQLEEWHILLVERDSEIMGFCAISRNELGYEIEHFWIHPKYMRQGWGKQLWMNIRGNLDAKVDYYALADPNAEAFYQKLGFQTIGTKASYPSDRKLPWMVCRKD